MPKWPDDFEWTGEYELIDVKMWYCPTHNQWGQCDGPCPDGTPHEIWRVDQIQAKVWRLKERDC
jgi:hypothetical protein